MKSPAMLLALSLLLGGCAHKDMGSTRSPSADKIVVLSMNVRPMRPMAMGSWRVSMNVQNTSPADLTDIAYSFSVRKEVVSHGVVPVIKAGETMEIISDPITKEAGNYVVSGKVVLSPAQQEANAIDRMNNDMALMVVVNQ